MKTLLLTLTVLIGGCNNNPDKTEKGIVIEVKDIRPEVVNKTHDAWFGRVIKEKEIDGCEYLMFYGLQSFAVIHKGNCKNKIHYFMRVDK